MVRGKANKNKKREESEEDNERNGGALGLDDALSGIDEENVKSGEVRLRKGKKKGMSEKEFEEDVEEAEEELKETEEEVNENSETGHAMIKASKPIAKVKKGDKMNIDGNEYEVDAHYVLMEHGGTKEMAIEIFDVKTDKDYQLRYFSDRAESTLEFYELYDIMYLKRPVSKIEW